MEEREELMVSPTGDGQPTLTMAYFLNPPLSFNDNPLHTLRPLSLSSTTSKTQTQKNPLNFSFKGWRDPQKNWKTWVDHMCSLHKSVWEKARIYESIMGLVSSIKKDSKLVIKFTEKWSPETKSFLYDFGEAAITLEDMMALGGYSVLGESVLTPLPIDNGELQSMDSMKILRDEDVVEGLERVVGDGNESTGAGNTSKQSEGTTYSRADIPGLELEQRIIKLEKLMAQLKAKRLGYISWSRHIS